MAGKFKLVWVVYVCMMVTLVSVETAYVKYMVYHRVCRTKMQCVRQAVRSKCTFMEMDLKLTVDSPQFNKHNQSYTLCSHSAALLS
jgi:hypothetical protein